MANIGWIKRNENGGLNGCVETLSFGVGFWLEANPEPKRSEKTPTHIIFAKGVLGGPVEIGCVREKVSKNGVVYKQIQFTDESIPEKYRWLAVFENGEGGFRIVYDPTPPEEAAKTEDKAA